METVRIDKIILPSATITTLGRRVLAGFIDTATVYALALVIGIVVAIFRPIRLGMPPSVRMILGCVIVGIGFGLPSLIICVLPTAYGQSTLGQRLVGVRSVRYPGLQAVGLLRSGVLLLISLIYAPATFILACINLNRMQYAPRLWYERMLGTAVVKLMCRSWHELMLCSKCGYDLRGSIESSRCPECGSPLNSEFLYKNSSPEKTGMNLSNEQGQVGERE